MERVHNTPGGERERQKQRKRGEEEEQKRDGSGKEEQVGLKQSPRHCDLCRPAKHSHQSHRNSWSCLTEGVYMPGTERWMQMQRQTVRPLKLTALCAVVMLVNDCLQTVCLCVITHRYVYVYLKNTKVTVYWCKSI